MLTEVEPLLPTRGYRVLCHDATLIDLQAEAMWPTGTQLEWTITTLVIGLPRTVVVRRCRRADVDLVLIDDGAVWPPVGVVGAAGSAARVTGGRNPWTAPPRRTERGGCPGCAARRARLPGHGRSPAGVVVRRPVRLLDTDRSTRRRRVVSARKGKCGALAPLAPRVRRHGKPTGVTLTPRHGGVSPRPPPSASSSATPDRPAQRPRRDDGTGRARGARGQRRREPDGTRPTPARQWPGQRDRRHVLAATTADRRRTRPTFAGHRVGGTSTQPA